MPEGLKIIFVDPQGNSMTTEDLNKCRDRIEVPSDCASHHLVHNEDNCLSAEADKFTPMQKRVIIDMFSTRSAKYKNTSRKSKIWNSILLKMPVCTKRTVYRYLNEYDNSELQVGEKITFKYSLTATRQGRGFNATSDKKGTIKYVIKCKTPKSTRAHMVDGLWSPHYKILKDEQQVNFENGTSFYVDRIHFARGIKYIYMHEI